MTRSPEILFHVGVNGECDVTGQLGQEAAAEGDMGAVVGQTGIRGVRQNHQIVGDDAGILQFADGVELAARQGPVAEIHVAVFFFAAVPAGKAGTHEQMAIEAVRDDVVEFFLAGRGMRRVVEQTFLPRFHKAQVGIGVLDEQLTKKQGPGRFGGGQVADPARMATGMVKERISGEVLSLNKFCISLVPVSNSTGGSILSLLMALARASFNR